MFQYEPVSEEGCYHSVHAQKDHAPLAGYDTNHSFANMKKSNKPGFEKFKIPPGADTKSHAEVPKEGQGMDMRERQGGTWRGVCRASEEAVAGRCPSNLYSQSAREPVSSLGACQGCWQCEGLPSQLLLTVTQG